jgi:hypothetical protein
MAFEFDQTTATVQYVNQAVAQINPDGNPMNWALYPAVVDVDTNNKRIKVVHDPTDPQDACNLGTTQTIASNEATLWANHPAVNAVDVAGRVITNVPNQAYASPPLYPPYAVNQQYCEDLMFYWSDYYANGDVNMKDENGVRWRITNMADATNAHNATTLQQVEALIAAIPSNELTYQFVPGVTVDGTSPDTGYATVNFISQPIDYTVNSYNSLTGILLGTYELFFPPQLIAVYSPLYPILFTPSISYDTPSAGPNAILNPTITATLGLGKVTFQVACAPFLWPTYATTTWTGKLTITCTMKYKPI